MDDLLTDQDVENLCKAEVEAVLEKHGCQMSAAPVFFPTLGGFYGVKVNVQIDKIKEKVAEPHKDFNLGVVLQGLRDKKRG